MYRERKSLRPVTGGSLLCRAFLILHHLRIRLRGPRRGAVRRHLGAAAGSGLARHGLTADHRAARARGRVRGRDSTAAICGGRALRKSGCGACTRGLRAPAYPRCSRACSEARGGLGEHSSRGSAACKLSARHGAGLRSRRASGRTSRACAPGENSLWVAAWPRVYLRRAEEAEAVLRRAPIHPRCYCSRRALELVRLSQQLGEDIARRVLGRFRVSQQVDAAAVGDGAVRLVVVLGAHAS
jgi:hypothetical protein